MNRPLRQYCLMLLLGTLAFSSCRKDARQEPNERPIEEGKTVTLSLSAEVGFEEEEQAEGELKGLDFKIEEVGTKRIPRPQITTETVPVHTVIKSNTGVTIAKTLNWEYRASDRKLLLSHLKNSFSIPVFNNDSGVKWYIAGLYADGTTLDEINQTVTLGGERKLLASSGNVGEVIGNFSVPYWTGWMELTLHTKDSHSNYLHGDAKSSTNKFRPLGTLIKYQLGNRLTASSYTFSPTGFTVGSNAFSDKGTFNFFLSTVPMTDPQDAKPKWVATQAPMVYSFASGHAPSTIAHNGTSSKVYYAWVMPYETQPATVETRVLLKGTSSRPETAAYKDYTKTYYTDYTTMGKTSGGKLQHGKIQLLSANATQRVALPIEYVTEYNLAGGGLLQSLTINGVQNQQPEGIKGALRFSNFLSNGSPNLNPHNNDQSGYYTWYELMGRTHHTYNPGGKSLQDEVNTKWPDQYFVPEIDHWWGVFPSITSVSWVSSSPTTSVDYLQLGYNQQVYYRCKSEYSKGFTDPLGSSDETNNAVVYAIRFKEASDANPVTRSYTLNNGASGSYQPLVDNSLRCAYRYTRIGGKDAWDKTDGKNLTNQLKIDVVYLGDAEVDLAEISNQSWWEASSPQRTAKGLGPVLSRTFPTTGSVSLRNASARELYRRGYWSPYWSASVHSVTNAWVVNVDVNRWGGSERQRDAHPTARLRGASLPSQPRCRVGVLGEDAPAVTSWFRPNESQRHSTPWGAVPLAPYTATYLL